MGLPFLLYRIRLYYTHVGSEYSCHCEKSVLTVDICARWYIAMYAHYAHRRRAHACIQRLHARTRVPKRVDLHVVLSFINQPSVVCKYSWRGSMNDWLTTTSHERAPTAILLYALHSPHHATHLRPVGSHALARQQLHYLHMPSARHSIPHIFVPRAVMRYALCE